jgi:membrane fusion protein, multidrug efflux system
VANFAKRPILTIAASLLILAAGVFAFSRWRIAHHPNPAPIVAAPPAPITEVTLTGRVEPHTVVNVAPPVDGVLDKYFVDVNQEVYQDQLLGRIRNPKLDEEQQHAQSEVDKAQSRVVALEGDQLKARLEASRAAADQTRAHNEVARLQKDYDRQQGLWAAGATARLDWEKVQKNYNDAKADVEKQDAAVQAAAAHEAAIVHDLESANQAVEQASVAVAHAASAAAVAEIHSPVDGIVLERQELQGLAVDPSMKEMFKIGTELTSLQVVAAVDASVLPRVHAGQSATVRIPELPPGEFSGTVREVRGAVVAVGFSLPEAATKLGQAAQVIIKF